MSNIKTIQDYFDDEVSYPDNICDEMLPYGLLLSEVSTTLLDGFINHVKPITCFILDCYVGIDEKIETDRAYVSNKENRFNYYYFNGTKRELINAVNSGDIVFTHTKFHSFGDDIVILTKINEGKYMWFWYHMSGRCDIGRFKTDDSENVVIESVYKWLEEMKKDDYIKGYNSLNIENYFEGWVSF